MRVHILGCISVAVLAAGPISNSSDPCGNVSIDPASGNFVDECGRLRFFRGLNVVYKGAPWHPITDSDGFDPFLSMNVVDAAVWQSLGLNVVRLGMMWPGVVPSPGAVNTSYLQIMHNLTDMLGSYGIYSLLDFHQDSVADLFCGEGIPTWAASKYSSSAEPFPVPVDAAYVLNSSTGLPNLQDCNKHGWTDYYFADAACKATQALYSNINGAADDFMFFWKSVASYWSTASWIIGYELMNEPWAGDVLSNPLLLIPGVADKENLQTLWLNTTAAIRRSESPTNHRIVFVESVTWDDFIPVGFSELPGTSQNLGALSYHYYDLPNFNADWQLLSRTGDARRLNAGAMLTEFDFGNSNLTALSEMMSVCDKYAQSYIGWEHKSYVPITGANDGLYTSAGTIDLVKSQAIARTFPLAVAGFGPQYSFDATIGTFSMTYELNPNATAPTTVFMSTSLWYSNGYNISVDSVPANLVTWSVEKHESQATPTVSSRGYPVPNPFSYALLNIQGTPASKVVPQVFVSVVLTQ